MGRPTNVLIADDEAHVRTFLRLIMRELGVETAWEARDGMEALQLIEAHNPELVLLDINMPLKGGLEVLSAINDRYPEIPVVVVSAQTATATVQQSAQLGAIGYIIKHSPKEKVMGALGEVLDSLEGLGEEEEGA
jgi:YesN/AraC family two-component response regulator